jgi:hypothetical protein
MERDLVFLDSVLLQQDMRIRLPKSIIVNINGKPGKTHLEIYFDALTKDIVIKNSETKVD